MRPRRRAGVAAASPRTKVIILSMCDEQPLVERMLGLGAGAFLHKGLGRQDLTAVIRAVNDSSERGCRSPRAR
jgi:DNA-binding NarL/FixJ family response regulator